VISGDALVIPGDAGVISGMISGDALVLSMISGDLHDIHDIR